jgi:hypothetical protein
MEISDITDFLMVIPAKNRAFKPEKITSEGKGSYGVFTPYLSLRFAPARFVIKIEIYSTVFASYRWFCNPYKVPSQTNGRSLGAKNLCPKQTWANPSPTQPIHPIRLPN